MWHEVLEEASRFYFNENNPEGMLERLLGMHEIMRRGPETLREVSFQQNFGRDLEEAREWLIKYQRTRHPLDVNQAWDLYYVVFKKINKALSQMNTFELQYVSPYLLEAHDLELAIPGTYRSGFPVVKIKSFHPNLKVFLSKQRPRRMSIVGNDGNTYTFLLKGHEDLRQDERVMQLFGLVNTLLAHDSETSRSHLGITRYAVIPLSPNSGLIGWVPNCDTLHALLQEHRETISLDLKTEHKRVFQVVEGLDKGYDMLTLIQKVEAFEWALSGTDGYDLNNIIWLRSISSESWLERRTIYTRTLAMMSMVGYILGLGDRHPSNLMMDRITGKVVHIDFGDCFEVAMLRDKYPEKIPFRLTRMLTYAMEAAGIEGNFRHTSNNVMRVMRDNKESLMAVLEAFVYDPLINWRLLNPVVSPSAETSSVNTSQNTASSEDDPDREPAPPPEASLITSRKTSRAAKVQKEDSEMPEVLNEKAVSVITRVESKLTGTDFYPDQKLEVHDQVSKLIEQATSHENLAQCYFGWCPFW
eukprot:TRINITY_DN4984_c0_g1_i1.p1 TRINITY_DN4984_c0_g1~~TRINITY_DN4984_c0_g1_i1.p1  ORF type:complete len:529 (+),score=216.58 TRINITY_DN4984_c0_g1_i1:599-2185(+)